MNVNDLNVETEDHLASLLEIAANNDLEGFRNYINREPSSVDEIGLWYGRRKGLNQMVLQQMTPLMVAATYGSIDVTKLILSFPEVDVNRSCGVDQSTALHYAASSGTINAIEVVKVLLEAGADSSLSDANGRCPLDVIVVSPKLKAIRNSLEMMLTGDGSFEDGDLRASTETSDSNSPPISPCRLSMGSPDLAPSPKSLKSNDVPTSPVRERKEYPIDPFLPDIKNSIYSTDEFRMFSFKVRPCSRAYTHDWTECPFVHPGENARRRDPRKYLYSCVPCPDFRKGATCRRGDICEYAHGVFECWLHPAQYRTRPCKDGTSCNRRVCFFAHTQEELRSLFVSTGSAVPSPRSNSSGTNAMDYAAAMSVLPGSPSSVPMVPPSPFTTPMSLANGISNACWLPQQQNNPPSHLSGSNLQSSRLRSSLIARDMFPKDLRLFTDNAVQQQKLLNELPILSQQTVNPHLLNHSVRPKPLTPSSLDDVFSAEGSSPRYLDQTLASAVYSPTHKSAVLNQFQQQQQGMLSPIKTTFSPRNIDHSVHQTPFGDLSSGRMSPRHVEPVSPMSARMSMLAHHENHYQQFMSPSARDVGPSAAAAVASLEETNWSKWGSPSRELEWGTKSEDLGELKRASSFELLGNGDEPDLSWVQTLVKESPQDIKAKVAPHLVASTGIGTSSGEGANLNDHIEQV